MQYVNKELGCVPYLDPYHVFYGSFWRELDAQHYHLKSNTKWGHLILYGMVLIAGTPYSKSITLQ